MRATVFLGLALAALMAAEARAAPMAVDTPSDLKSFNVTVRRFDPTKGMADGTDFVLPVNSPDAEHACASTLANAASFSKKVEGSKALPLAFSCTKIEAR